MVFFAPHYGFLLRFLNEKRKNAVMKRKNTTFANRLGPIVQGIERKFPKL